MELCKALFHHSYQAVLTILTMLYNLLPFLDGMLYLVRFILDKLIEICQCHSTGELIFKSLLFTGEMVAVVGFCVMITSFIILPVWCLAFCVIGKLAIV